MKKIKRTPYIDLVEFLAEAEEKQNAKNNTQIEENTEIVKSDNPNKMQP